MASMERHISILGTGDLGSAMACRLIESGYSVTIGSRLPSARNLEHRNAILAKAKVTTILESLQASDIIVVAIPFSSYETLKSFAGVVNGKILIDVSNPSKAPIKGTMSNAEVLADILPEAWVVKAFNTVSAFSLADDTSNEHRQVFVASDHTPAIEIVMQIGQDIGYAAHNCGRLQKARDLEAQPLHLFRGWGWPTLFTIGVFLIEVLYLVIVMYIVVDRYDTSMIPSYMMYKACGAVSVNLLAFCYLPGILAAFAQVYYGTKHKRFQPWLDQWLKARKQLGAYALLFAFLHMIALMSCMNDDYFSYLFTRTPVTIKANATEDIQVAVDSKMNLHGEGCIISGLIAITTMAIMGLTSLPPVGALLNWREWRFIQSQFGFVCFLLTVTHCMVHGVARWTIQYRELHLRNSFMSLLLPWVTLLLKMIYFIPCLNSHVWKIRGGYERNVTYDREKGREETNTHDSAKHMPLGMTNGAYVTDGFSDTEAQIVPCTKIANGDDSSGISSTARSSNESLTNPVTKL